MIDSQNPDENCDCSLFMDPVLRDGCENFKGLYWNNPQVSYEEVTCPEELSRTFCWLLDDSANDWPSNDAIPEFCSSNIEEGATTQAPPETTTTDATTQAPPETTTQQATTQAPPVTTTAEATTQAPPVTTTEEDTSQVSDAECAITIQPGASAWWAGLEVGFESNAITLDFSSTGLDLDQVTLDQGVFSAQRSGQFLLTLVKPDWVSLSAKGYMGFNGQNVPALANLVAPSCIDAV